MKKEERRFKRLKEGAGRRRRFAVFDLETKTNPENIGEFLFGGVYDIEGYKLFTNQAKMISYIKNKENRGKIFFAHNLEYDLNRLFMYDPKVIRLYLGGRLLSAKIPIEHGFVHFYDSAMLSNYASVEQLGDMLGFHKKVIDYNENTITEKYIDYNKRDCEICYRFVEYLENVFNFYGCGLKMSLASAALEIYRRRFMPEAGEYWRIKPFMLEKFREGYFGGRTEVFKFGKFYDTNYYDINSSYPFAMLNEYPLLDSWKGLPDIDREGLTYCKVETPEMYYPVLPYRKNGKLFFPTGEWFGWYYNNELRYAKKQGIKITPLRGVHFQKTEKIFFDYVMEFYEKKNTTKNPVEKRIYKILMNSLYGKFALKNSLIKIENNIPEILGGIPPLCVNVIWSGITIAEARINLHRYLLNSQAVYCDTDSVLTMRKLPVSDKLGKLGLKGKFQEFQALGNKHYITKDENGIKRKIKGIPKDAIEISPNVFRFQRPIKYLESKRRKIDIQKWIFVEKTLNLDYDKRMKIKGRDSRPFDIREIE